MCPRSQGSPGTINRRQRAHATEPAATRGSHMRRKRCGVERVRPQRPGSTRACFVVALSLGRNPSRQRADVPALEAQKRTGGFQPDTRLGPADRTRRELLRAKPLMQVEIRHRCGRRADFHIVCLDAATGNGPNGLSRVEKVLCTRRPVGPRYRAAGQRVLVFSPRYGRVRRG